MAEEATALSAGGNRACSNGRDRENKCSSCKRAGAPPRRDLYAMEVDRGRNCYACGGFGHIAYHYRNRGRERPMEGWRVDYGGGKIEKINNYTNNLKGVENLELLD